MCVCKWSNLNFQNFASVLWLLAAQCFFERPSNTWEKNLFGSQYREQVFLSLRRCLSVCLWGVCHLYMFHACPAITDWDCRSVSYSMRIRTLCQHSRPFPFGISQWCHTQMTAPFTLRDASCQNHLLDKKCMCWEVCGYCKLSVWRLYCMWLHYHHAHISSYCKFFIGF